MSFPAPTSPAPSPLLRTDRLARALALAAATALASPGARAEIPFEELGQAFLEQHCPEGATAASCGLDEVLGRGHAWVRIGAFDAYFPAPFFKDGRRMEIRDTVRSMLELQQLWFTRYGSDPAAVEAAAGELAVLIEWVDGWSKSALGKVAKADLEGASDLLDLLEADDAVRAAAASLAPRAFDTAAMALVPQYTERLRVVFCPTRRDFMEFVGYSGLAQPALREMLWNPGVHEWTQYWADSTMIAALEYAPWHDDPEFKDGLALDKFDKDGLRQHIAQQAATCLVATSLNRTDVPVVEKGLAVELTMDLCGAANTIDGEGAISSTGASTAPYSRFVPGGNPNGGVLPAIPAAPFNSVVQSDWRKHGEASFYAKPLRSGQKAGAKRAKKDKDNALAKNEIAHFELKSGGGKKLAVSAPFLGKLSEAKPYPDEAFLNDYREFFRSYQACFLAWLREHAFEGNEGPAKLNEFLTLLSDVERPSMDEAAAKVFGEPLTTADGSAGLEWRFLSWLADQ